MRKSTMVNLDVKGNLAKLLATENVIVQHDNVKTASFNVKDRVLTLPIFKVQSGDVYDMLIAHECSHALWTPQKGWEKNAADDELRAYINVLEDTRIDKKIQKKYPGVVKNYLMGWDILDKQNFFGLLGKDINKDLMIIDKINLRSKSSNRLTFKFAPKDKKWLVKVDAIKSFKDVVALAKEMLNWQKKQVEKMKKLPDFDLLSTTQNYDLGEDNEDTDNDGDSKVPSGEKSDDDADEKNDFNNFGDQKADSEKDSDKSGAAKEGEEKKDSDGKGNEDSKDGTADKTGTGKDGATKTGPKPLKVITQDAFNSKIDRLLDSANKGYSYGTLPEPNIKKSLVSYKNFLKTFRLHIAKRQNEYSTMTQTYKEYLKTEFKKFQNNNKKTVMYLVKEFEMKKSATAYKRASTDKTGVIDPLKLKDYKFSEDIFKRLTILPDGKNHGMMMLLDWSGSMSDTLMNTVEQLLNLIEFCKKVNIPFEVYFFNSDRGGFHNKTYIKSFNYKKGDWMFEDFQLVNIASHRMKKIELQEALMYVYQMGMYYNDRYGFYGRRNRRQNYEANREHCNARQNCYGIPDEFGLGNTPLNEALIYCMHLIPEFKKKYAIEKLTFITLTDGGANSFSRNLNSGVKDKELTNQDWDKTPVFKIGKKKLTATDTYWSEEVTNILLNVIKDLDVNVIGFFILKRVRRWDIERYFEGATWSEREAAYNKARGQMKKDKAIVVDKTGYNKFFLLDGKSMNIENFSMDNTKVKKGTVSEFKRIFGKSMKNRLISRVVLNKFIQEVA
jgi:hypothetical protein|tara:strand:- start:2090 stop:4435 length:2346 start_codon:yes stop_codon:yes gene_type:complete